MSLNFNLNNMTNNELRELSRDIELLLRNREKLSKDIVYEFPYDGYGNKKNPPYISLLSYNFSNKKIERTFFYTTRTYNKNKVKIAGKIFAREGDVVEVQQAHSSVKYRYVSVVKDGKLELIGDNLNPNILSKVESYIKGEISIEKLITL